MSYWWNLFVAPNKYQWWCLSYFLDWPEHLRVFCVFFSKLRNVYPHGWSSFKIYGRWILKTKWMWGQTILKWMHLGESSRSLWETMLCKKHKFQRYMWHSKKKKKALPLIVSSHELCKFLVVVYSSILSIWTRSWLCLQAHLCNGPFTPQFLEMFLECEAMQSGLSFQIVQGRTPWLDTGGPACLCQWVIHRSR